MENCGEEKYFQWITEMKAFVVWLQTRWNIEYQNSSPYDFCAKEAFLSMSEFDSCDYYEPVSKTLRPKQKCYILKNHIVFHG